MKLVEFLDKLKNYKNEIIDMPAHEKVDPTKCIICGKKFKDGEKGIVSDVSGNQFHQECFDKAAGNDELNVRRTDNQLPYDEDTIGESRLKPGMKEPPKGYKFAHSAKEGDKVKIWSNVPKGLKLGQTGEVTDKDGSYLTVLFMKVKGGNRHEVQFYPNELIMKA